MPGQFHGLQNVTMPLCCFKGGAVGLQGCISRLTVKWARKPALSVMNKRSRFARCLPAGGRQITLPDRAQLIR